MRRDQTTLRRFALIAGCLVTLALTVPPVHAQTPAPAENLVEKLSGFEAAPDLDLAALRQQVTERVRLKKDAQPLRRPPIAPELQKLPQSSFEIQFDQDTPIIRPASYQTIGRIADALARPALQPYVFLIVDHIESVGRRDGNLTLSQRRADAVRDVLSTTFKISPKRLHALGLGEEQLQDSARPNAPANLRVQIMTIGRVPEK